MQALQQRRPGCISGNQATSAHGCTKLVGVVAQIFDLGDLGALQVVLPHVICNAKIDSRLKIA
jgi:hypothetical protein